MHRWNNDTDKRHRQRTDTIIIKGKLDVRKTDFSQRKFDVIGRRQVEIMKRNSLDCASRILSKLFRETMNYIFLEWFIGLNRNPVVN